MQINVDRVISIQKPSEGSSSSDSPGFIIVNGYGFMLHIILGPREPTIRWSTRNAPAGKPEGWLVVDLGDVMELRFKREEKESER